jgi:glycosyltransferase involved in cell wall biosynthesis
MNDQNIRARSSLPHEQRALRPVAEIQRRVAIITHRAGCGDRLAETVRQLRRYGVPDHALTLIGVDELEELDDDHHLVLSPTYALDLRLTAAGVAPERIARWQPGVDRERFSPAHYGASAIAAPDGAAPARFHVLLAGAPDDDRGAGLLAAALRRARERDPRLQLVVAGGRPAEAEVRSVLGDAVTFLDGLDAESLSRVYASADLGVCPDAGEGFGDHVLQAQASGLPVLAIEGSGPGELIESGRSGCLVAPDPDALGAAIAGLARRATLRERLATGGLLAVRERTGEQALAGLAARWDRALGPAAAEVRHAA